MLWRKDSRVSRLEEYGCWTTDAIGTSRVQGPLAFRWGSLLIHLQPVFAYALLIDTKVISMIYCICGAASHLDQIRGDTA